MICKTGTESVLNGGEWGSLWGLRIRKDIEFYYIFEVSRPTKKLGV